VIAGPTAAGKTAAAVALAERLGTEILSADSRQFYREMKIGTAVPSEHELQRVKHHFIGHLSVQEPYNVARFESDALKVLGEIFHERSFALLTGGSGLYINAVCHGIDELPDPDPELRTRLKQDYLEKGIGFLQQNLLELDPAYYAIVDLHNPSRLLRAIEVCLVTGKPYSSFRKSVAVKRDFAIRKYGLSVPRDVLIGRIHRRVDLMLAEGLVEEVRTLLPYRSLNALNTVGYKEIFAFLDGQCSMEQAKENIRTNTRRYAKRQMTWLRKDQEIKWVKDWMEIANDLDTDQQFRSSKA